MLELPPRSDEDGHGANALMVPTMRLTSDNVNVHRAVMG